MRLQRIQSILADRKVSALHGRKAVNRRARACSRHLVQSSWLIVSSFHAHSLAVFRRKHGVQRQLRARREDAAGTIGGFSDGVIAIIITIMVLEMKVRNRDESKDL